jgi:molecular chaperone GrpE
MEGLEGIYGRLNAMLAAEAVTRFESLGRPFDPSIHKAVGVVESSEQESGTVVDVMSPGYLMGEALLRPARVRVAR